MYKTALVFSVGISGRNGFLDTGQTICAENQDILDAAVSQLIQHCKPVFGAFVVTDLDGQYFFVSFTVNSKNNICCHLSDDVVVTH